MRTFWIGIIALGLTSWTVILPLLTGDPHRAQPTESFYTLALISILLSPLVGFILAIFGLFSGFRIYKDKAKVFAFAGWILCIISLVIQALYFLIVLQLIDGLRRLQI